MSLASICSGNFHQIRNNVWNNFCVTLIRRCDVRLLTTRAEGRKQELPSITLEGHDGTDGSLAHLNSNQLGLHESKSNMCYNLQKEISGNTATRQPVTILVFDIETTGFSQQSERIIEFALRDLTGGRNSIFQTLINPEKDVLNAYIHGIKNYMVNKPDVPRFKDLVPILLHYVRSRQTEGNPVLWVAHNGRRFDVPFIVKEFQRCSAQIPADWLFVDTLPIARQLLNSDGSKLGSVSLKSLKEHYDIPLEGPEHRAMQDVTTLCYVLQRITFDLKLTVAELVGRAFQASELIKVAP
ncbi:exonuclease DPD1, chloroplastic/mitochondrial-like isoform X1 [Typha latifolia]|uniref:exonuclease DPD1, chloroplastic/mitochondrial-like isoform X1 n=1 Tax=Typha latifolia TaxID=4733 RepID=UPI003C2FB2A7